MDIILGEHEIPPHLAEFFEPMKSEFTSVIAVNTMKLRGRHFAPFPEHLVTPAVIATCPPDGIVLDPFTGSGTTGVVAVRNGREFVGIEVVPESAQMAIERIQNAI